MTTGMQNSVHSPHIIKKKSNAFHSWPHNLSIFFKIYRDTFCAKINLQNKQDKQDNHHIGSSSLCIIQTDDDDRTCLCTMTVKALHLY